MKLFLCSHTIIPNLVSDFEEFSGKKFDICSVAFVWTGAKPETEWTWKEEDYEPLKQILGSKLELIDIEELHGNALKEKLLQFDILWMNGGQSIYLMKHIHKSGLKDFLPELFNKGILYLGSSAGSMICAKTLESADWFIGESEPGASKVKGLGYIDFQIYPHYEEKDLPEIRKRKPKGETYYFLKNGQAISIEDGKVRFYGGEPVILT